MSLETIDTREYAREDPRGFLAQYPKGAIIDEIHNTPDLLSYLQSDIDKTPKPGRFISNRDVRQVINIGDLQLFSGF